MDPSADGASRSAAGAVGPMDPLGDLRMGDLSTFLVVRRCGSITGAARELCVTPSQVSKAVGRLERHFHVRLLSRGGRGVSLNAQGLRLAGRVEEVVGLVRQMRAEPDPKPLLTFAAPSFLLSLFLPSLVGVLPGQRVRGLELPPALLRAHAAENFFDVTLTVGPARLPRSWVCDRIGEVRKALFGAPATVRALGSLPVSVHRLRHLPFISPVYNVGGQFVQADEDCPLGSGDRRAGHEVQTLHMALDLAASTDQVVFGPAMAAHRHLATGVLEEIPVAGWSVSEPLFVCCNAERVLALAHRSMVAALRAELAVVEARVLAGRTAVPSQ